MVTVMEPTIVPLHGHVAGETQITYEKNVRKNSFEVHTQREGRNRALPGWPRGTILL